MADIQKYLAKSHELPWLDELQWFPPLRRKLADGWIAAGVNITSRVEDEPCSALFSDVIDLADGHISLACSIMEEYSEVSQLLIAPCFDTKPTFFFRLLLFLLDEFTERLRTCYTALGERNPPRQPKRISLWANRYAKHKQSFFIQHHAIHVFQDAHPAMYEYLVQAREDASACLRSGLLPHTIIPLDEQWLKCNPRPKFDLANNEAVPAVLVPSLTSFVSEASAYLASFIAFAKTRPAKLKKFQSVHQWPITATFVRALEERLHGTA